MRRNPHRSKQWIARAAVIGASCIAYPTSAGAFSTQFPATELVTSTQSAGLEYHVAHDSILGTSLDLIVSSPNLDDGIACERVVLDEIERLRRILSTYDPSSEISRYAQGSIPRPSSELQELFDAYENWNATSGGAIDINMAEVTKLWRRGVLSGTTPDVAELRRAKDVPTALNIDALGKGYIIDRVVQRAREIAPAGLLNIGGDIRVWGDRTWPIGVADPANPGDNVPATWQFPVREAAIATSGGYARFYQIGNRRYSHIIDPRTLQPVNDVISATAIAPDCLTANALSTAASALGIKAGTDLIDAHRTQSNSAIDSLMIDETGQSHSSGTAPLLAQIASPIYLDTSADDSRWPADRQMSIGIALKTIEGGRGVKRPYIAVWIEDAKHKVVRTITVWGNQPKYTSELTFWRQAAGAAAAIGSISRGTRPPGTYSVVWDGKDDRGNLVARGSYTVVLEINREHGRHVKQSAVLDCTNDSGNAVLSATAESDESKIEFGPRPAK